MIIHPNRVWGGKVTVCKEYLYFLSHFGIIFRVLDTYILVHFTWSVNWVFKSHSVQYDSPLANFFRFHLFLPNNYRPITTKHGTKHLWVKCFQVCSNERPNCIWRADNKELMKLGDVVYNSYKTLQLTTHYLKMVKYSTLVSIPNITKKYRY